MSSATVTVEKLVIPTYPSPQPEEMPMFAENRVHQRSSGRPYPQKVVLDVDRKEKIDKEYTLVILENAYLSVWILPEIGGRIYAALDKTTGYDFFYRQHVIKPALIGALGSWVSGGLEFNWPFHHRASGFMPCNFTTEEYPDGTVACHLSEHDPLDRMEGSFSILLRPDEAIFETRMNVCNRTNVPHSFLWWENAAVPVNESYRIFFPKDVSYVNFHYLKSRISYPIAGDAVFNGIPMYDPRDISWHKNTKEATSYFASASKYDFFGGYDYGLDCGVVHIADHHIAPGKKLFTWGYNQLSKSWENALTDTDGQYAELMAGSYSDNQPNFSWLEPYESKRFSQYWYPIAKIGAPDYADENIAMSIHETAIRLYATKALPNVTFKVSCGSDELMNKSLNLETACVVEIPFERPTEYLSFRMSAEDGTCLFVYTEEAPDMTKKPDPIQDTPLACDIESVEELYLAGLHVDQYRDPAVMPDSYWKEALKRNPKHTPSLIAMAQYCYNMYDFAAARNYIEKALKTLTVLNTRLKSGEAYYVYAQILEALGETDNAYDHYYKAAWCADSVSKAMANIACIDIKRKHYTLAVEHADTALTYLAKNPLALTAKVIALQKSGKTELANKLGSEILAAHPLNLPIGWMMANDKNSFLQSQESDPAQSVLDIVFDFEKMGLADEIIEILETLLAASPKRVTPMIYYTLAYYQKQTSGNEKAYIKTADQTDIGDAYPVRQEEIKILRYAAQQGSKMADFYLGCLLYNKRHYVEAAELFKVSLEKNPDNYMTYRCLSTLYYSHLDKKAESLALINQAIEINPTEQLIYEKTLLMSKLGLDPKERLAFLLESKELLTRDDTFTELARAYNDCRMHEKALETLLSRPFVPCEGGEHEIADEYMFALFMLGQKELKNGNYKEALAHFVSAKTLPQSLGAGIWNHCKYVPYKYYEAVCLKALGEESKANEIFDEILNIEIEYFSNMHLKELPYYQALSAMQLGLDIKAHNIVAKYQRLWEEQLGKTDSGFFGTTPFFISYIDTAAEMRRAQFLYLTALMNLFEGHKDIAKEKFAESYALNSRNLFCGFYKDL